MTTYMTLETALRIVENSFLVSAIALIAVSYIGLAIIDTLEKSQEHPKPKWFS
ncbi:MAG: hypothetical protein WBB28_00810 [Crinalium sp.]